MSLALAKNAGLLHRTRSPLTTLGDSHPLRTTAVCFNLVTGCLAGDRRPREKCGTCCSFQKLLQIDATTSDAAWIT